MQLTAIIKLRPDKSQEMLLLNTMKCYIQSINSCVDWMFMFDELGSLSSKHIIADLPAAVKNQVIREARSIFIKYKRGKVQKLPVLKKLQAVWNNQNYKVLSDTISFPITTAGKTERIQVKAVIPEELFKLLSNSALGTLRITVRNSKWIAQITYYVDEKTSSCDGIMGIDLGIKCPAVCYTNNGKVKFIGNGRHNRLIRRKYYARRKKLGKAKKTKAIQKTKHKEKAIMRDIDHKTSRQIVDFAVSNGIKTIKIEKLQNIRKRTTSKSRKNNRAINSWSFYRLAQYIEYKANLRGIEVQFVTPAYTSQICPQCGKLNHANDRTYQCECGFHCHRDLVGARNILVA